MKSGTDEKKLDTQRCDDVAITLPTSDALQNRSRLAETPPVEMSSASSSHSYLN